jgi:hypothetical protein
MSLFVYLVLAVYDFHFRSIPFQELRSFLTLTPDTALHFHSNHTLQHPAASGNTHFHFASFIHLRFPQAFFLRISNGLFLISANSLPH